MHGNQVDPSRSVRVRGLSLPERVPFPNQAVETLVQNNEDTNFTHETDHIQSTPTAANPSQSSSSSQGSYHISASSTNSTPQRSISSYSQTAEEKYSSSESPSNYEAQEGYNPSSFGGRYEGYNDNTRGGGWNSDRRQSRVSFNLASPRSHNPSSGGPGYPYLGDDDDDDDDDSDENTFNSRSVRHAFIRKVYFLIMCMMVFTCGVVSFFLFHIPTRRFIFANIGILLIFAWVLYLVLIIALCCFETLRRKVPINYFMLCLVTAALSLCAGCTAVPRETYEVLGAFGITAAVCLGLTIFAIQTKWDFTVLSGALVGVSIILMIFGICLFFWRNKIAMLAYSCLGALVGCMFFIFDTQMIIGGKRKYVLNPEEYVYAAITLFTDVINIFIYILSIIGLSRS